MLFQPVMTLLLAALATAHPGEDHALEAVQRAESLNMIGRRSLSHCTDKLAARGVYQRNIERRAAFHKFSKRSVADKRDLASVVAMNHKSNATGITNTTSASEIFGSEHQCVLAPEVTQGPYYVTGEYMRSDVRKDQEGVQLYLDIQLIDINTCEPLSGAALDFWHCNAMGVYSGVVAHGNGDGSEANANTTFLRGIQSTNDEGVVQFHTVFPGHYSGRATHIHMLAHTAGTWQKLANNTITGGTNSSHVGQLFFDQDLITQVTAVAPYSSNNQSLTLNTDDMIMSQESDGIDPVMEYVLLGDTIADGLFGWISVGVNSTAAYTVQPAMEYGEEGGVANPNSNMGGGGGPGGNPPNGTGPSGKGGPPGSNSTNSNSTSATNDQGVNAGASSSSSVKFVEPGFIASLLMAIVAELLVGH